MNKPRTPSQDKNYLENYDRIFGKQRVWVGNFGTYQVPREVEALVRFTKSGWPDKRCRNYQKVLDWVKGKEQESMKTLGMEG